MQLYIISGVTGMTGNELARKLIRNGNRVIGFDNFFASSLKTVEDILENTNFNFYEYDLNNTTQMNDLKQFVQTEKCSMKNWFILTALRSFIRSIFIMSTVLSKQMCLV